MGGEAAVEILDVAEELGRLRLVGASSGDKIRQLAELHVLEAQLAARIAPRNLDARHRGDQRRLLRLGPAPQVMLEIEKRDIQSSLVVAPHRAGEVVEAVAQRALPFEQPLHGARQTPASPGSIRVSPSSIAQRSIDSDTTSSTSAIGRASSVRSIDFT